MISDYHLKRLLFNEFEKFGTDRQLKTMTLEELDNFTKRLMEEITKRTIEDSHHRIRTTQIIPVHVKVYSDGSVKIDILERKSK